ncbi:MAG: hypothetical protein ACRDHL_06970 [Candidatus Promineifilaceae bacterium]
MKESPISDMFGKIEEESTVLGRLAGKIPGFKGYLERSRRREADQLLRETLANRLEESRLYLSNIFQDVSRDIIQAIDYAEEFGRTDARLMGLIGKIKDAPQGYAGLFDAIKIEADDLARIYAFDESMLAYADQLAADLEALAAVVEDEGEIGPALAVADGTLREANAVWARRGEVMTGTDEPAEGNSAKKGDFADLG